MTKRVHLPVFIVLMLGMVVAGWAYLAHRVEHHGEGPPHSYPLAGSGVLTDEEAISLARRTLELDGRFSEKMKLEEFGNGRVVNRGTDTSYMSLSWCHPGTNDRWFVQLHRKPGTVDAVSYPGK